MEWRSLASAAVALVTKQCCGFLEAGGNHSSVVFSRSCGNPNVTCRSNQGQQGTFSLNRVTVVRTANNATRGVYDNSQATDGPGNGSKRPTSTSNARGKRNSLQSPENRIQRVAFEKQTPTGIFKQDSEPHPPAGHSSARSSDDGKKKKFAPREVIEDLACEIIGKTVKTYKDPLGELVLLQTLKKERPDVNEKDVVAVGKAFAEGDFEDAHEAGFKFFNPESDRPHYHTPIGDWERKLQTDEERVLYRVMDQCSKAACACFQSVRNNVDNRMEKRKPFQDLRGAGRIHWQLVAALETMALLHRRLEKNNEGEWNRVYASLLAFAMLALDAKDYKRVRDYAENQAAIKSAQIQTQIFKAWIRLLMSSHRFAQYGKQSSAAATNLEPSFNAAAQWQHAINLIIVALKFSESDTGVKQATEATAATATTSMAVETAQEAPTAPAAQAAQENPNTGAKWQSKAKLLLSIMRWQDPESRQDESCENAKLFSEEEAVAWKQLANVIEGTTTHWQQVIMKSRKHQESLAKKRRAFFRA